MYDVTLFGKGSLFEVIERKKDTIVSGINEYKEDIIGKNIDDLCDDIYKKYSLKAPILLKDQIKKDKEIREMQLDRARYSEKTKYFQIEVPFTGNRDLFLYCPSTWPCVKIKVELSHDKMIIPYEINDRTSDDINREIDRDIGDIEEFLKNIESDLTNYNNNIKDLAKRNIEQRIEILKKDRGVLDGIKFPAKKD